MRSNGRCATFCGVDRSLPSTSEKRSAAVEHHIPITKTARYWTLGDSNTADEVWFVLHGYKQLARRFLRRFQAIDDGHRLIVAPEALSRFYIGHEPGRHGPTSVVGATWMTREDRQVEIEDYVGYLDQLAETILGTLPSAVPVTVLGFSQGVATATRWVTQGTVEPSRLVLWGDFTPPDLDCERAALALASVEVLMVRGEEDAALASKMAADEAERLGAAGIEYQSMLYRGGHDIEVEALRALISQ